MTLLPLLFIKMATRCEAFLFGDEEKAGVVNELKAEMLRQKDLQEQTLNKAAEVFEAAKAPLEAFL